MDSSSKKRDFSILTLIMLTTLLVTFLLGEAYIRHKKREIVASNKFDEGLIAYDRLLGWKLIPNWKGRHQQYDFDVEYSTNRYGFRGDFGTDARRGAEKIAFVGDSFTFSLGVNDQDTFVRLLNRNNQRGDVYLNFGVPGYSTDQELLLIKERVVHFKPEIMNMLHRRYYRPKSLAEAANYEERFSDHLDLFYALIKEIKSKCQSKNISLTLALMPGSSFVLRPDSPSAQFQDYFRQKIIDKGKQLEIPVIDLAGLLREISTEQNNRKLFHPNEGHLTDEGHLVVAEYIQEYMTIEKQHE